MHRLSKSKASPLFRSSICIYIFKEAIVIFQINNRAQRTHTNIEKIEFGGNNYVSWFNFHIGRIQKDKNPSISNTFVFVENCQ